MIDKLECKENMLGLGGSTFTVSSNDVESLEDSFMVTYNKRVCKIDNSKYVGNEEWMLDLRLFTNDVTDYVNRLPKKVAAYNYNPNDTEIAIGIKMESNMLFGCDPYDDPPKANKFLGAIERHNETDYYITKTY